MLKTRIIPTLLLKDIGLVKGEKFDSWRRVGSAIPTIKVYNSREVDELILVDITATNQSRTPDFESIAQFSKHCFVPLTVGGGIKNLEHVRALLRAGADKICINSAAYDTPNLISEIANNFGSQCVVVSIDVKKDGDKYHCYSHSGSVLIDKDPVLWAQEVERLGAGEILLTSIERDGTFTGYDTDIITKIVNAVDIPVIASGGAGNYEDMYQLMVKSNPSAIAAASIFHFTEQTPKGAKGYLANKGIHVRRPLLK